MEFTKIEGKYDGSQIKPGWSAKHLGVKGDSFVVMRGPMDVKREEMVDMEDMRNNEKIKGGDMIHFIIEHYDSSDIHLAYYRQRMLVMIAEEWLCSKDIGVERRGDDLFVEGKKISVSIATVGKQSQKIHLGINLKRADITLPTIGLYEVGMDEHNINDFCDTVSKRYTEEIEKIKRDIKKTKIFT